MVIYELTLITFNNGYFGDFDLPKTLGYFSSIRGAERFRNEHSARMQASTDGQDRWTTAEDYRIKSITVINHDDSH